MWFLVGKACAMVICDEDDLSNQCKKNIYKVVDGNGSKIGDCSPKMSNNSFFTRTSISGKIQKFKYNKINGEPGFINATEAARRKPLFQGCNPCGEILLQSKQCCNLTTNNLNAFVEDHVLNLEKLKDIIRLSTRVAIRMTLVDVELPEWNKVMTEDRIIGISLTGMMDMMNKTQMNYKELGQLLKTLREVVHNEGEQYCKELGISAPQLMTTINQKEAYALRCKFNSFAHSNCISEEFVNKNPLFRMLEIQGSYPP